MSRSTMSNSELAIYLDPAFGQYSYEEKPWFRADRFQAFSAGIQASGWLQRCQLREAPPASDADLQRFHTPAHVARVTALCARNEGALDHGPTFARAHVEHAARLVAGAVMDAARQIAAGVITRAFVPISGFHHGYRDAARMYCLYNDVALGITVLLEQTRGNIGYIDFDAHYGDGVDLGLADEPRLFTADIHQDGSTLWPHSPANPGTGVFPGAVSDNGTGAAKGTRCNLPLPAFADDSVFESAWETAESHIRKARPTTLVVEAGVDGMAGDPMASLGYSERAIRLAVRRARAIANDLCEGRLLVLGGGGYKIENLTAGWTAVVEELV